MVAFFILIAIYQGVLIHSRQRVKYGYQFSYIYVIMRHCDTLITFFYKKNEVGIGWKIRRQKQWKFYFWPQNTYISFKAEIFFRINSYEFAKLKIRFALQIFGTSRIVRDLAPLRFSRQRDNGCNYREVLVNKK